MPASVDFSNPSLLYALCWTLIEQKERKRFKIWGQEFTRDQCLYEIYRHLPTFLPQIKIRDFHELDDEKFLKDFAQAVLAVIKAAQPEASGPTATQLEALVDQYQTHLQDLAQAEELKKDLIFDQFSLENQLKLIARYRQFQDQIKSGVEENISVFYPEKFKKEVTEEIAERLFQETASQTQAVAPTDETFVKAAINKIFQESPEADLAFSPSEKKNLTSLLIKTIAPMDTKKLVEGHLAYENLIQTSLPTRENTLEKIREVATLGPDASRETLNKAETLRLATRQPTEFQVREILRQARISGASINPLVPYVKNYLHAHPVAQAQGQPDPSFITSYALNLSRKLGLAPTTTQDALDGLSVTLLKRLQERPGISEAQRQLFEERIKSLQTLRTVLAESPGFRFFKLRIAWNQNKARALNLFDENNPLSPVFYRIHFPDLRQRFLERQKYYQAASNYLKKTSPLRFIFTPRQQARIFFGRSKTLSRFFGFLPKLKPSYWLGRGLGGILARKGATWAAGTGIKAFAGKALGFIGTKLLGKAAGSLIGTAIGGPVGTVVSIVAAPVLGKILDKSKKWIKRGLVVAGGAAALLLGKLFGFLFAGGITTLFTLAGAGIGFLIGGPIGGLLGAGVGGGLGHLFGGLFGKGAGVQAASSAISGANTLLSAPTAATVSAPVAAIPVVTLAATGVLTATVITIKGSAFIPKEIGGGIDAPKNVVTTPDCDHAACKIIAKLKACGISQVTRYNFQRVAQCLSEYPKALAEFEHSVKNVDKNLQCVGFKVGVEKEEGIDLSRLNAVGYLYNSGCKEITSPDEIKVGDNAVWGPRKTCPNQDPEEANKLCNENHYCCGHIGVITKVGDFLNSERTIRHITVTQAWGNSGQVNSITTTSYKVAGGPWKIIRCD